MNETFYYIHKRDLADISVLADCKYVEAFYNIAGSYIEYVITTQRWQSDDTVYLIAGSTVDSEVLCVLTLQGIINTVSKANCSPNILNRINKLRVDSL